MRLTARKSTISIGIAAISMLPFGGCLPLPPLTSTPQLALHWQQQGQQTRQEQTQIRRWLANSREIETIAPPPNSNMAPYDWIQVQPFGSNLLFRQLRDSISATYVTVPDSDDRRPRLLYATTKSAEESSGLWPRWSPDGRHINTLIDRSVVITAADGSNRRTLGTIDGFAPGLAQFGWSPDGSTLAFTTDYHRVNVVNANSGATTTITLPTTDIELHDRLQWMSDNRHIVLRARSAQADRTFIIDVQNPASIQEKIFPEACCFLIDAWSPDFDRLVQSTESWENQNLTYKLIFLDERADVPLLTAPIIDRPTLRNDMPAWSDDGERLAYATDIDEDGDIDVTIASKEGIVLQTYPDIAATAVGTTTVGITDIAALGWSPDNARLLVVTTTGTEESETLHGRLITLTESIVTESLFAIEADPDTSDVHIAWSPNSRHVVFRIASHSEDTGESLNAQGLLIDTNNLDAGPTSLHGDQVLWSPDSNHLALTSINETKNRSHTISVITLQGDDRIPVTLTEHAEWNIQWSIATTP